MEKREDLIETAILYSVLFVGWMIFWSIVASALAEVIGNTMFLDRNPIELFMWKTAILSIIWLVGVFPVFLVAIAQTVRVAIGAPKKTTVRHTIPDSHEQAVYCIKCGSPLNPKTKFCGMCGSTNPLADENP
ncbi:MAG: zinc ribbon domain-containing protein [Thermoplasmata archaeon]|nr:MAG: zinc ribbon domain-containing protein [Thermoplasmata archaeon]